MSTMTTGFGPREPEWVRIARDEYWAKSLNLDQLETRIKMTDAGCDWLTRVKRAGLHRHRA